MILVADRSNLPLLPTSSISQRVTVKSRWAPVSCEHCLALLKAEPVNCRWILGEFSAQHSRHHANDLALTRTIGLNTRLALLAAQMKWAGGRSRVSCGAGQAVRIFSAV